jgi:DNA-binding protein
MAKRPNIIPKASVARILMNAGAKRVSASAVDVFTDVIQALTEKIAERSAMIAKHSGRKTVKEEDVKLAAK